MDVSRKNIFDTSANLDSSLKKNTAFIKRIRTGITPASQPTFISEIRSVSLHKYLSEIISATYEGLCKLKSSADIAAGVEIVSALHQRFGPAEFTRRLGWLLGRGLSAPDKAQLRSLSQDVREREEKDRLARHRALLRVVTELWLVGVLRSLDDTDRPEDSSGKAKDGTPSIAKGIVDGLSKLKTTPTPGGQDKIEEVEPFPLEVLKELLSHDRDHTNLPLAVIFVKSFAWDILGVKPELDEGRKLIGANGEASEEKRPAIDLLEDDRRPSPSPPVESSLVSQNLQNRFKNVLTKYFEDVKAHIVKDQRSLNAQSRRNAEAYVKSGEIFEDRQANFDKQTKAQEKLISNAQILCDALGAKMPDLAEKESADGTISGTIGLVKTGEYLRGQGDGAGIWEDEEERRFYENLVDLKGRVPSILLDEGKKKKADGDEMAGKKSAEEETNEIADFKTTKEGQPQNDEQSVAIANKTVGAQVDALLGRLPELQTKEMVDNLALEFCFLNSKASRNRLIKTIQDVPKGRSDLLPLYSRLVATLGQYLPDIVQGLISYLDDEFRSLQRRKVKDFLGQVRIANIRYLAELTKFGVVPEHIIFHCLKVSLEDFSRMNIEIIASLLENCGRFLFRNPDTAPRMISFLETLNRRKSAQHLGLPERMLLENALYYVDPPQRTAIQQKERTPTELFVRQLIYLELGKRNCNKVLKTLRKLHWEEQEVVAILEKVLSKPGKVKFSNVHLLAVLVSTLYRYHQEFAIGVVDNVLEQITLGLEQNDFKFNQRRIAEVKYLGELYNYKMVDSTVIFDSLYRIITFGHENGTPTPGKPNSLDMPDDYFRVRLVCTTIDTCGVCFDRGSAKKKLEFFLTFFQYYLLTKEPLPLDVDFMVKDTYALVRPSWKIVTEIGEAARLFSEAIVSNYVAAEPDKPAEVDDEIDSSASSDDLEAEEVSKVRGAESSSEEAETLPNGDATPADSGSDDEHIYVRRPEEERDPELDAEFDRELEKMMSESVESRKFERRKMFDEPLPVRSSIKEIAPTNGDAEDTASTPSSTMAFSLMTKRGNKQQTRNIDLPSDSHFALAMKTRQQADWEEKQRIKNIVLEAHLRDDSAPSDGDPCLSSNHMPLPPLQENPNTKGLQLGLERQSASQSRPSKSSTRTGQQPRRLQFSDADWYGKPFPVEDENSCPL